MKDFYPLSSLYPNKQASYIILALLTMSLFGCDHHQSTDIPPASEQSIPDTHKTTNTTPNPSLSTTQPPTKNSSETANAQTIVIDWQKIDGNVTAVKPEHFNYSLTIDSPAVLAYAEYFHITPKQAQHSLTVSTASNEVLSPLLDQIGNHYLSHKLTDGKVVELIVYTTKDIQESEHDYILTENFAKGLILPIRIKHQE